MNTFILVKYKKLLLTLFWAIFLVIYLLRFAIFLGSDTIPDADYWLSIANIISQLYIVLFLFIRFYAFRDSIITSLDQQVIVSGALLIMLAAITDPPLGPYLWN